MNKECRGCGEDLDISCFYKHAAMADGHLNHCKECVKERVRARRTECAEEYRARDRARFRTKARRAAHAAQLKAHSARNPEKYRARYTLSNAVRDGRVTRGDACEDCGSTKRIEGHHEDYSKPLDVNWLCFECHRKRHDSHCGVPF